jgi:multiple sugar transport system ATP-binding protein
MTMGQRVAVLKDGRLQQVGAPLELYERPVNRFVAGFIGSPSMSFIPAELAGGEQGGRELRAPGLRIPVPPSLAARLHAKSGAVVVGLRPEHVGEPSRFGDAKPLTRAQVTLVEQLGSEAFVHLQLEEVELLARYEAHSAPRAGETVDIAFAAESIHLFDAEDGRALISSAPERKSPWDSAGSSPSAAIA